MESSQAQYRILHLLVVYGDKGVVVVTAAALLMGLVAVVLAGFPWMSPLVVLGCVLLYIVARSYVELVRVIVDMLLPN